MSIFGCTVVEKLRSTPPVARMPYGGKDVIKCDTTFIPPPGDRA
jgi:hypothetical protein